MPLEPFVRLLAAAVFAGAIGVDRELRAKPAGLRTNIVVGVAAATFAYLSITEFPFGSVDESRVAAQIVSGVGFLGGGAIFAAGGKPHGLTTAAALWGSAAAGLAAGVGAFMTGLALVVVTLIVLWPLELLGSTLLGNWRRTDVNLNLVCDDLAAADKLRYELADLEVGLTNLELRPFGERRVAVLLTAHGTRSQIGALVDRLRERDDVSFVAEETAPQPPQNV